MWAQGSDRALAALVGEWGHSAVVSRHLLYKALQPEKRIAYAEVYAPMDLDAHGDFMRADEIENMAHRFLRKQLTHKIDLMHDERPGQAVVVESFIARAGDPDFTPGAWVLGVHVPSPQVWQRIKNGELTGLSFQARVRKETVTIDVADGDRVTGTTMPTNGHTHTFWVQLNGRGRVLDGGTSTVEGHTHAISEPMRTAKAAGHQHTYQMHRPISDVAQKAAYQARVHGKKVVVRRPKHGTPLSQRVVPPGEQTSGGGIVVHIPAHTRQGKPVEEFDLIRHIKPGGRQAPGAAVLAPAAGEAGVPGTGPLPGDPNDPNAAVKQQLLSMAIQGDVQPMGGGINRSYQATLEDGTKVAIKPNPTPADGGWSMVSTVRNYITGGNDVGREEAAQLINFAMGTDPVNGFVRMPTVVTREFGKAQGPFDPKGPPDRALGTANVFSWVPGDTMAAAGKRFEDAKNIEELGLYDAVIGNQDRHGKNAFWDAKTSTAIAIDHGLAFPDKVSSGNQVMDGNTRAVESRRFNLSRTDRASLARLTSRYDEVHPRLVKFIGEKATAGVWLRVAAMQTSGKVPGNQAFVTSYDGLTGNVKTFHGLVDEWRHSAHA